MIRAIASKVCDVLFGPSMQPKWYLSKLSKEHAWDAHIIVASERAAPLPQFVHDIAMMGANVFAFNVAWNMWGAFSADGELIGLTVFTEVAGVRNIDLVDIVVLPAWRRLGIGSALLEKALERADESGRFVSGMFRSRDFESLKWLKNRGFKPVICDDRPIIVTDLFGTGVDGYGMYNPRNFVSVRIAR